MIVALVGGLWAVLAIGGQLVAPEDLGGRWSAVGPGAPWPGLTVEQSGRYFQLTFDNGPAVAVTMQGGSPDGRLSLGRGKWHVTIDAARGQARTFHLDGPIPGTFTGHRGAEPTKGPATKEAP